MNVANKFELHYYFNDQSHEIDAVIRNKCEAELLGIISEVANLLEIDAKIIKDIYREGGFRDIWRTIGANGSQIGILLVIVQIVLAAIPLFKSENNDLEEEERRLSIEEKKLNIEKLRNEIKTNNTRETIEAAASSIGTNLKIIKRKSNFYSEIKSYSKVEKIGYSILDQQEIPIIDEVCIPRSEFDKYILESNRLKSEKDDAAIIEIIAPVLKEGRYKWKGLYKNKPISFDMQDHDFRDAVLSKKISFQHGTRIACVLNIHRELDETGNIKVTGYSATIVIEKIDGDSIIETMQGKKYRHSEKARKSQIDLFHK